MKIGVPKEIKNNEYRVGMTPAAVHELCGHGHDVFVETQAGAAIGFTDEDYQSAGAQILADAKAVFGAATLIVKVKEPQPEERALLNREHTLFTYLHLAPDQAQTDDLVASGAICIAYETVTDRSGRLPLLAPMSEVAGRMSIQAGAHCLEKSVGGRGVLLGGVPGVSPARVTVVGGGVVGQNAVAMAIGMGAQVTVLDRNMDVLRNLDHLYGNRITTLFSTVHTLDQAMVESDLVVGSVLIPGASAPKLITRDMIRRMPEGSVLVDVAIDQGGCAETSKPTTHDDPTYIVDGVVHYCVANMPGAVARTSTLALNNVTLPFVAALANKGPIRAMKEDPHLMAGLNIADGKVTYREVAEATGHSYTDPESLLGS
ncbi:alanine dehydrogenase [Marinobacter sp. M216]|uniref:Alanine dehydrogenase n=1 Tax=Marinobacter albus TaxID=3030833 RepID=A0ABT7H8F8_9GAMM|nr:MULTISPECIES: alanine dehydrogenase [unclassified Marinobacter]MBW7471413.1 alanine dehydrogenase [Marinobacter sp. F4218]MDK9556309.1 alanine dehydrogenase [Marinobacter sp. M216]